MCHAASELLLDNSHPVPHTPSWEATWWQNVLHTGLCTFALHEGTVELMISSFQFVIDWSSPTPWYPFLTACFPCCLPILPHSLLFALVFKFPLSSDLLLVYNFSVPASLWGLLSPPAPGAALCVPPGHRCLGPTPQSCSCLRAAPVPFPWTGWCPWYVTQTGGSRGTPGITALWFEAQQAPDQPCSEFLSVPDSLVWPCWASSPGAWGRAQHQFGMEPAWGRGHWETGLGHRDLIKGAGKHLGKFKVCPLLSTATLEI